jgi:hypothetical protein
MRLFGCIAGLLSVASAIAMAGDSASGRYSLKLSAVVTPEFQTMGLYLKVRIDGGPVLRLLLDSGAQNIVLDRHAAAKVGHATGTAFEVVGVGGPPKTCKRTAAATVEIGDLVLKDCPILAFDGQLIEGVDGIIPTSLFADFLVRLDLRNKTLELTPYPAGAPAQEAGYLPTRIDNRLVFLQSLVDGSQPGYVLLDTGATFSALSPQVARASRNYWSLANSILLQSGAGDIEGFQLPAGVRFRCGASEFSIDPAVVVDLSDFTRHHQFAINGILGYPALRNSVVTMNYRDSLVRIEHK